MNDLQSVSLNLFALAGVTRHEHLRNRRQLPAADRQPAIEIALQIVATGETAGMVPVANSMFGWDEADADQAAPAMVVNDTDTTARCLWSPGQ